MTGGDHVLIDDVLLRADGRRVGYRLRGDRTAFPILYFHGEPGSRLEADLIPTDALHEASVLLVSFDRPGMGRSDLIPARDMVEDVTDGIEVMDHLGFQAFAVLGVSAGGPPALAIAATRPDRVTACVLCCASGPYDDESLMPEEDAAIRRRLLADGPEDVAADYERERAAMLADLDRAIEDWFADFPEAERQWITSPPAVDALRADFREALRQGARGWLRETEVRHRPWTFDPAAISQPVHAFHGNVDTWELLPNTRRVIDRIPDATLTEYPGGAHLAPLMRPAELLAAATGRV